jgi:hypothetical protein
MSDLATMKYAVPTEDGKSWVEKNLSDVLGPKDMWNYNNMTIIGLNGIQKLMDAEGIVEKKFEMCVTPTADNKQQHVCNIWVGFKGQDNPDEWKRASGEASQLNTGKVTIETDGTKKYNEHTPIDSKYRMAMADKRALCRAVLKIIRLYGVYSEVEAAEFRASGSDDLDY